MDSSGLPGEELIRRGLADLAAGRLSAEALLVAIGAPRLHNLALEVPSCGIADPEHRLYELLASSDPDSAHSRYNGLIRRLVRFERALECVGLADAQRIRRFMEAIGRVSGRDGRIYFTGGATAVLFGWRQTTIDIDILLIPDDDRILREIPRLKEELHVNVELACPADFIPELPGWEDRSRFIERIGKLSFLHYDLYAQALAKIERRHAQDVLDVEQMLGRGLVDRAELRRLFAGIEPLLYRFPALDPAAFKRAVDEATRDEAPPSAP